jgi:uncharacterized DUF497 family protein
MNISFDSAKSERNERERGLTFSLVGQLDWSGTVIEVDERKEYGEQRYRVLGFIGDRLYAVVFTPRAGKVHVISLRKANKREVKQYEQKTQP